MVEAMHWISRLTTVRMEIVLPGLLGHWLDRRGGPGFLALVGFGLGVVCGMQQLLSMTRMADGKPRTGAAGTEADETTGNVEETQQ